MADAATYTGDTTEAENLPPQQSAPSPSPRFVIPQNEQPSAKQKLPELNLELAYKTLDFYQRKPQYLANPFTSHAANAHLSQASKIIGMNIQLERLNNSRALADSQIQQDRGDIKSFQTLAPFLSADELGSITDENGNFALTRDSRMNLRRLQGAYADKINPKTKDEKTFAPGPIKTAFDNADAADAAGKPQEAEVHRAYGRSLAGLTSKNPDAVADKAKAANLKKLQDLDFKLAQEFAKHQKEFRIATSLKNNLDIQKAEASALAVQKQRDELAPQIAALQETDAEQAPAGERITTREQFDALDSGTVYTGKDGKQYRKP